MAGKVNVQVVELAALSIDVVDLECVAARIAIAGLLACVLAARVVRDIAAGASARPILILDVVDGAARLHVAAAAIALASGGVRPEEALVIVLREHADGQPRQEHRRTRLHASVSGVQRSREVAGPGRGPG